MALIKPIEGSSVHRIQSGQVIVDLCSIVKELVENSLDAGATSIEVRFKNHGLDAVEVHDNGSGIAKEDYSSIALKHYTSKLRTYDDLSELETFGFRGEALSSLCALADVHITTACEHEAPKGNRLDFETSGQLKGTSTVAAQRGTTVSVETIFKNLPVRRQELTKNIKREYGKVLELLQAYACISTSARIAVVNTAKGGKRTAVFATKANQSTRENIANVFGAKTLGALVPLDLQFEMERPQTVTSTKASNKQVRIQGYVSRPVVGEGRSLPDRQMFFVNGRPCALPQVAKVINEVYKTYNLSQMPFVVADVVLDTGAYDVNVSPDKRSILLHDQGLLLESIKISLTELFEKQQQSVPQSQATPTVQRLPSYKQLSVDRFKSSESPSVGPVTPQRRTRTEHNEESEDEDTPSATDISSERPDLIQKLFANKVRDRDSVPKTDDPPRKRLKNSDSDAPTDEDALNVPRVQSHISNFPGLNAVADPTAQQFCANLVQMQSARQNRAVSKSSGLITNALVSGLDIGFKPASSLSLAQDNSSREEPAIPSVHTSTLKATPGVVQSAFDRMRPLRQPYQTATITIGGRTTTTLIGSPTAKWDKNPNKPKIRKVLGKTTSRQVFANSLRSFTAPGSRVGRGDDDEEDEEDDGTSDEDVGMQKGKTATPKQYASDGEEAEKGTRDLGVDRKHIIDGPESEDEMYGKRSREAEAEPDDGSSDDEYLEEEEKKAREERRVAKLIQEAEECAARPTEESLKRAARALKGGSRDATTKLLQTSSASFGSIKDTFQKLEVIGAPGHSFGGEETEAESLDSPSAEERLSLSVSKDDFSRMRIIGQFNLGFIVASRSSSSITPPASMEATTSSSIQPGALSGQPSDLFIIDQHASDEKYNFERLYHTTTPQTQRLVHPQRLDLTAIEEEIIIENQPALTQNGFEVEVDDSGEHAIGRRCQLVSLPMSREVTFSTRDLEELLALLADSPQSGLGTRAAGTGTGTQGSSSSSFTGTVVRPSSVRRMFAMRACRSSVMIGRTLQAGQMRRLVANMGLMDKPWNCPHGRPTMRHLIGLGAWRGWEEGEGVAGSGDGEGLEVSQGGDGGGDGGGGGVDWVGWVASQEEESGEAECVSTGDEEAALSQQGGAEESEDG